MTNRAILLAAAILAGGFTATAAQARPLTDGGVTVGEVADALSSKGYKADISKDGTGDPLIKSAAEGVNFQILFYGCDAVKRCTSLLFTAGWDLSKGFSMTKINDWNFNKRFGRASLDGDNDPFLRMDEDYEHGAPSEAIGNDLDRWDATIAGFKTYIEQ